MATPQEETTHRRSFPSLACRAAQPLFTASSSLVNAKNFSPGELLTESDINRVRDKFNEDCNTALEDAIRKHHNMGSGSTPLWLYATLVYFAYDDIFRMLGNPLLFYPLVVALSILAMLWSMGLGPVMVPIMRQSANLGLRRVGVPY